nr:B3 domain-containing protein Os01g0234100-like [Tanacetum cinerariifolium]
LNELWEAKRKEQAKAEEEMKIIKEKLNDVRGVIKNLDVEIETLKQKKGQKLDTIFHKEADAPWKTQRKDTELPQTSGPTTNIADEAVNKEMDNSLMRDATTAFSLEAEQDSGNINKTQSKATPNEPGSQGTSSGVNTPQSDEDSLKLKELLELCTNLQNRVLDLETTKTTQAMEIVNRSLSRSKASLGDDASKQGRKIDDIDADEGITLVDETVENQGRFNDQEDAEMLFDVADDLKGVEVFVSQEVPLKKVSAVDEVNAEQAPTPIVSSQQPSQIKDLTGVGYNAVPPPATDLYLSPKKDLSWIGLSEFADDTVTDYSRPSPTIESTSEDGQNRISSASENGEPTDSILSKPAVKFVKAVDRPA